MGLRLLEPGDPCPICGQPIITHDPNALLVLSEIADFLECKDHEEVGRGER